MRQAASEACQFVEGLDEAAFWADRKTRRAVLMTLLIVGEIAARIMDAYPDVTTDYPAIRWHSIRGMRNRIAHGYFDLDMHIVWTTLQSSLPDLIRQLDRLT